MNASSRQDIQANRYILPYHYLPQWKNGAFTQTKTMAWGYEYLSYINFMLDLIGNMEFTSLLDVGSGDGRFLLEASLRFSGKRLAGVDYSNRAISFARAMNPQVDFACGLIQNEDLLPGKFDIVTLIETLEHIPPKEITQFVRGISNKLKPHGHLLITVPCDNVKVTPKHYQHFSIDSIKNIFAADFSIKKVYFLNRHNSLRLNLINRFLTNRFFILNNRQILSWFFRYYCRRLLITDRNRCRRLAIVMRRNDH